MAMELAPRNSSAYAKLGLIYQQQGDHSRAEKAYLHALSLNARDNEARISLARLYQADRQFTEAVAVLEEVLQNEPGNVEAIVELRKLKEGRA